MSTYLETHGDQLLARLRQPLAADATTLRLAWTGSITSGSVQEVTTGEVMHCSGYTLVRRTDMTLAAGAGAGAATISVNTSEDVDADVTRGIQNLLKVGTEDVTVTSVTGTTLTLASPLAGTFALGTAVTWREVDNQHHGVDLTITRTAPSNTYDRGAEITKLMQLDEFILQQDAEGPQALSVLAYVGAAQSGHLLHSQYSVSRNLSPRSVSTMPLPAGAEVYLRRGSNGNPPAVAEVSIKRVADETGVPLALTAGEGWFAEGTMALYPGQAYYESAFSAASADAATVDFEIANGRIRAIRGGFYTITATVY